MVNALLQSLRERMLDEAEPLAGLLRKCLLLGAETGSRSLRDWARRELNGYGDEDEVPEYRKVHDAPLSMDSISGRTWATGQTIHRLQIPPEASRYLPERLEFRQPVEELERLGQQESLNFGGTGVAAAQGAWNQQLGPFDNIVTLRFIIPGALLAGMLGQVRTQLVDVIADLTADTPLSELPGKASVDAAVHARIGQVRDVYSTTIQQAQGPTAIGAGVQATVTGLNVQDALLLLEEVRKAAGGVPAEGRAELDEALDELQAAVHQDSPDTGDVVKKIGRFRAAAEKLGVAAVTSAASTAGQALTELAVSGAFN